MQKYAYLDSNSEVAICHNLRSYLHKIFMPAFVSVESIQMHEEKDQFIFVIFCIVVGGELFSYAFNSRTEKSSESEPFLINMDTYNNVLPVYLVNLIKVSSKYKWHKTYSYIHESAARRQFKLIVVFIMQIQWQYKIIKIGAEMCRKTYFVGNWPWL